MNVLLVRRLAYFPGGMRAAAREVPCIIMRRFALHSGVRLRLRFQALYADAKCFPGRPQSRIMPRFCFYCAFSLARPFCCALLFSYTRVPGAIRLRCCRFWVARFCVTQPFSAREAFFLRCRLGNVQGKVSCVTVCAGDLTAAAENAAHRGERA